MAEEVQRMDPRSADTWWPFFQQAPREGDLDAVLRLYEPGAAVANPSRHGHAERRHELEPLVDARADFQVSNPTTIASADLALIHTAYRLTRPLARSGHALEVLRRQVDGGWLLAIGDPFTIEPR
jgi:ketosteroid isomerase-like protein